MTFLRTRKALLVSVLTESSTWGRRGVFAVKTITTSVQNQLVDVYKRACAYFQNQLYASR